MTVSYNQDVATERIGGFFLLLFRWRGSVYRAIRGEFAIFMVLYFFLSALYRFGLRDAEKRTFEQICIYFDRCTDIIPVTFFLGAFLVMIISGRWTMWENIPCSDQFAFDVSVYVKDIDDTTHLLRRTLVRYANLASILLRDICVRKRYPTLQHLVNANLMNSDEMALYEKKASDKQTNWWIPDTISLGIYSYSPCTAGRQINRRNHDAIARNLRNKCQVLFAHDWIPVPMVYMRVVTLSVYLFMLSTLFGQQYLDPDQKYPKHDMDLYFSFFTFFQLAFYLGWLKVCEVLINPMGLDADDFDMNYIVDKNISVAYAIVDNKYEITPLALFTHCCKADTLICSKEENNTPFFGSAVNVKVRVNVSDVEQHTISSSNESGSDPLSEKTSSDSTWLSEQKLPSHSRTSGMGDRPSKDPAKQD